MKASAMALLGAAVLAGSALPQQASAFVVGTPSLARLSADSRSPSSPSAVVPRCDRVGNFGRRRVGQWGIGSKTKGIGGGVTQPTRGRVMHADDMNRLFWVFRCVWMCGGASAPLHAVGLTEGVGGGERQGARCKIEGRRGRVCHDYILRSGRVRGLPGGEGAARGRSVRAGTVYWRVRKNPNAAA